MKHGILALIKSRKLFFIGILFLLIFGVFYTFIFGDLSIPINTSHPFWRNVFFVNYTFMGDAVFALCLSAFFIFYLKRKQQGMALFYGFFLTEIIVQSLKNIESFSTPDVFTEQGQYIFLTDNISSANHSSIISGHTAIVFAMITVLIFSINKLRRQLSLLIAAALLGYSRMYLAQNHLTDVLIGTLTGTTSAIIAVYFVYQFKGYGYYYKRFGDMNKNSRTSQTGNMQPV